MRMRYAPLLCFLLTLGCGDDGQLAAPGNRLVFMDRGAKQCESDGQTPEANAQVLIGAGIDVLRSTCGFRTGVAFPAVCGGPTADILVHEIRHVNVVHAEPLGFRLVETLVDAQAGTGYRIVDCADRTPIAP